MAETETQTYDDTLESDLATLATEITSRHRVDKRLLLPLAARRDVSVARNATGQIAPRNRRPYSAEKSKPRSVAVMAASVVARYANATASRPGSAHRHPADPASDCQNARLSFLPGGKASTWYSTKPFGCAETQAGRWTSCVTMPRAEIGGSKRRGSASVRRTSSSPLFQWDRIALRPNS